VRLLSKSELELGSWMLNFERCNGKGSVRDVLSVPASTVEEAQDALRNGGFVACDEQLEDSDDEDGCINPPSSAYADEGGIQAQFNRQAFQTKLWSIDGDTGSAVGFYCQHDLAKRVMFAYLKVKGRAGERYLKRAITSLFDVAEACSSRRITIGFGAEYAGNPEFVCSLLYLGFQVVPPRKSPFANVALMLDFHIGVASGSHSSDHTYTGTSDCSTSAEDCELLGSESPADERD